MIAGETEMLLKDHLEDGAYDEFLFFGSKEKREKRKAARKARRAKRRSDPNRIARKEKRRNFLSKLGQAYQDLGGGEAIGGALDSMIGRPPTIDTPSLYTDQTMTIPSDLSIGMRDDDKAKNDITTTALYVTMGAVLVGGIAVLAYKKAQKH